MGWTTEVLRSVSRQGTEMHVSSTASKPNLGATQPPDEWIKVALSQGISRLWHESDHSRQE